ncbi:MAG TPA: DUF4159 domain-containing protein, partial [Gemmatales bacterium]|nr:DUF4159 domain-containing protein [Gemmatales bacterium]
MFAPRRLLVLLLACSLLGAAPGLVSTTRGAAQRPEVQVDPESVRSAIRRAIEFLKTSARDSSWEHRVPFAASGQYYGGPSALALLALLEAGVDPDDPVIQKGIERLKEQQPRNTYTVSLQTMVLAKAKPDRDRLVIKRNVDWLLREARRRIERDGRPAIAWHYPMAGVDSWGNSNTQNAVLALREAHFAGVPVPDSVWREIEHHYVAQQLPSGGWRYQGTGGEGERFSMTTAGAASLVITNTVLSKNMEQIKPDGTIENCGRFQGGRDDPLKRAIDRVGQTFRIQSRGPAEFSMPNYFYSMYGVERAGRFSGMRFFEDARGAPIDWYRMGAKDLLASQRTNGSWQSGSMFDGNEIVATSFSLLFLAKGRTPVLMYKMMHGPKRDIMGDWNNDRNDVRNLVEFCSQEVFKKDGRATPLSWQIFDAKEIGVGDEEGLQGLLQAPIVYFNGHKAPRFGQNEKILLQQYAEQGGFIFAEACCGRAEFDQGFRELVAEMWPDRKLVELPEGHPIWSAYFNVAPGSFKLHGIDAGCKTFLIYAAQDMSCHWESNEWEKGIPQTQLAFRLAANIVAYATGLEPPEDKLSKKEILKKAEESVPRGFLQVAQVNYGGANWQPAPNAMRALMTHVKSKHGVDVVLQPKPLMLGDPSLTNFKFLYMHGRSGFQLSPENGRRLRDHLEHGGLLLADAACGSAEFDTAFRAMVADVFGRELQPIPLEDPLFSSRISTRFF